MRKLPTILVAVITALLVQHLYWWGPILVYQLRSPSPEVECAAIKPGMSRAEVNVLIGRTTEPPNQTYSGNRIEIWRKPGRSCRIDLDGNTGGVTKAYLSESGPIGFGER